MLKCHAPSFRLSIGGFQSVVSLMFCVNEGSEANESKNMNKKKKEIKNEHDLSNSHQIETEDRRDTRKYREKTQKLNRMKQRNYIGS